VVSAWLVEEIAGNALACASNDRKLRDLALAQLVPGEVYDARLAFNVACIHAAAGEKARALHWIAYAIELGRDPASFLGDSDFRTLWGDPDFSRLVPGKPAALPKSRAKARTTRERASSPKNASPKRAGSSKRTASPKRASPKRTGSSKRTASPKRVSPKRRVFKRATKR